MLSKLAVLSAVPAILRRAWTLAKSAPTSTTTQKEAVALFAVAVAVAVAGYLLPWFGPEAQVSVMGLAGLAAARWFGYREPEPEAAAEPEDGTDVQLALVKNYNEQAWKEFHGTLYDARFGGWDFAVRADGKILNVKTGYWTGAYLDLERYLGDRKK